jgi:hypothetical protein
MIQYPRREGATQPAKSPLDLLRSASRSSTWDARPHRGHVSGWPPAHRFPHTESSPRYARPTPGA